MKEKRWNNHPTEAHLYNLKETSWLQWPLKLVLDRSRGENMQMDSVKL